MYRKSHEVIGFIYEADLHCIECARKRFAALDADLDAVVYDNEDNMVGPIFIGDDGVDSMICGDCLSELTNG